VHALDVGEVDAVPGFVRAAGVEEEQAPGVLAGVEQAVGLRVDGDAAAGIARADEMGMAVPDVARLEALPGADDELVLGEPPRQPGEAGIPKALLRPVAPRDRAARERGDAERA
jgi:hypothetical protein